MDHRTHALVSLGKEIVAHAPLLAIIGGKEFGASKVEDSELVKGLFALEWIESFALCVSAQGLDALTARIALVLLLEPVFAGLGIMLAIDPPDVLEDDVLLEVQEQIVRRHCAAREEILSHPSIVVLKVIRHRLVAEDVDEQQRRVICWLHGGGLEPRGHLAEEERVILHVLKHLNADDAVKFDITEFVQLDIAREDLEIVESARFRCLVDIDLLRLAVGQGFDAAVRILCSEVQGNTTPAAPEIKYILTVAKLCLFAVRFQHRV